jgi:hypothetical protein
MNILRTLALASLILLGKAAAAEPTPQHIVEEIEFEFEPSFEPTTKIFLFLISDGTVRCAANLIPELRPENAGKEWKHLKTAEVSLASFKEFAAVFEDREFRAAAEVTPGGGMDGTSWVFRKTAGSRKLEYKFWTPEARPNVKSSALAIRLGKQIAAAAGLSDMFSVRRKTDLPE